MIRLFVGLDFPEEIKDQLYTLRGGLEHASFRTKDRFHLTLRFVGNVNEKTAEDILKELKYIRFPAFHLALKGLGYFSIGDQPHHLWVGVENDKMLTELHQKIDGVIKKAGGGTADKFKFMPHVTLAKLNGTSLDDVFRYIAQNNLFRTEPFLVDSFTLFASHARENGEGKYYTSEEVYPLSLI